MACYGNNERASRTGTQGRWGVLQKETEVAGGGQAGPTMRGPGAPHKEHGFHSKCKEEPWTSFKQNNTISLMVIKITKSKPPSVYVKTYNLQSMFTHLTHISSTNPVNLEPR